MGKELTTEEKLGLFDELIVASGQLATFSDNCAVVLSKEYEEGVRDHVNNVRAILKRCPQPAGVWDGDLHDEHLTIEYFVPEARRAAADSTNVNAVGVKITHDITGISRQADAAPTRDANEATVRRSLKKAIHERWVSMNR